MDSSIRQAIMLARHRVECEIRRARVVLRDTEMDDYEKLIMIGLLRDDIEHAVLELRKAQGLNS